MPSCCEFSGGNHLRASGPGTVTLSFGRAGATAVASGPAAVILHLHEDGTVTINDNTTPI